MSTDFIATAKAMPPFRLHDLPPKDQFLFIGGPHHGLLGPVSENVHVPSCYVCNFCTNIFGNLYPVAIHKAVDGLQGVAKLLATTRFAVAFGVA